MNKFDEMRAAIDEAKYTQVTTPNEELQARHVRVLQNFASAYAADSENGQALRAAIAALARQEEGREAVTLGEGDFYGNGSNLPTLHPDPLTNAEILISNLCARLDTARQALADAAAMQVVYPNLTKIKMNAAWAMDETKPSRVLPRSAQWETAPPIAALAPPSAGEGDDPTCECCGYPRSMNPLSHDPYCRVRTHPESELAKREMALAATPTPQSGEAGELALNAVLRDLLTWKSIYLLGREHFDDEQKPLAEIEYGTVLGDKVIFSMKDKQASAPASPQGVSEGVVERAMDAFSAAPGDWLRNSMRAALEAVWPTAAGAAPEGWPARYACNGPEGTFWTDDAVLANRLLLRDAAIERDEWTVTDTAATPKPGAQHGQEGRDG